MLYWNINQYNTVSGYSSLPLCSTQAWDFESAGPNIASRQGWTKLTFKAGDKITVVGNPMKDGSKAGSVKFAKTADGKVLYHDVERKVTPENTPSP